MPPLQQVPHVQFVTVAAFQQNLRVHSLLHHAGSSPFAGDQGVESQMPPEVIGQELRTAIQLPFPKDIKAIVTYHENSAGTSAISGSQCAGKDSVRTAVDSMR